MATVLELAKQMASQGVTRERFNEILGGFGIDPTAPGVEGMAITDQVASVPLMQHEGASALRLKPPEPPISFDTPLAFTLPPAPEQPASPPLPGPTQQLPYATDVRRPFEAQPGAPAVRNQPVEPLPSGVADYMRSRPVEQMARAHRRFEGLPSQFAQDVRKTVEWAAAPREPLALEQARGLESGLDTYQKGAVGGIPERAAARGQAALTRAGALAGTLAGGITSAALEGYAAMNTDEWDGDETISVFGVSMDPAERRGWSKRWELENKESADLLEGILSDAVVRSGSKTLLENAAENALEFAEATYEILSWMSGGNIPKEFWEESTASERKKVLLDMGGMEVSQGRGQHILEEEATKRWPEMSREMVAFVQALFNKPGDVAKAYPIVTTAMVYPIARRLGVPLSKGAANWGRKTYNAMNRYADSGRRGAGATRGAAAVMDSANELWALFQRWKVDPTHMADPAMRPLAHELLPDPRQLEQGVKALGPQLANALDPPPKPGAAIQQPVKARRGRPVYEELSPDVVVAGEPPPGAGFSFKDVPGGELPEVAATRAAMGARRAGPVGPEGALIPEVLERGTPLAPTDTPLPPQPQPLGLPAPGQVPPRVGKYTLSPEAEAIGLKLLDMDTPWLRQLASDAFKGRAPTQLDRAALAEALAYLTDSVRHFPNPQSARAALMQMMERAGGDPFVAAERAFRAQETPAGARMVGQAERVVTPGAVADLPEVAATREAMGARRAGAVPDRGAVAPPDINVRALRERARAAIEESREYNRALVDRVERARSQGQPRDIVERLMEEALADETSYLLRQRAHEAQRMLNEADAAMREGVPGGRGMVPFEEPPVTPEPAVVRPGHEMAPWYPPGRAAYESPKLSPGLTAPRESRGYSFDEKPYTLQADGTFSPSRRLTPEGALRDEPAAKRSVEPRVRNLNQEVVRLVEDAAEFFEDSPLSQVPGFRALAFEEAQLALENRIANNMQVASYREGAVTRIANEIERRSRRSVDRDSMRAILDEAKEGGVNNVRFRYQDVNGKPGEISVVDAMARYMDADPELAALVRRPMAIANMRRLAITSRKLSHQNTALKSIRDWHPEGSSFVPEGGVPRAGRIDMQSAAKSAPDIPSELQHFIDRYVDTAELPPLARNSPSAILKYAKDNNINVPSALVRRLNRLKLVPPEMLEAFGLQKPANLSPERAVRTPDPVLLDSDPVIGRVKPELYLKDDLLNSARWIFTDEGWASGVSPSMSWTRTVPFFKGLANYTKAARVALNPSSHANAWISNAGAAALKNRDPLALVKALDWALDYKRWQAGLPTKRPAEFFEAISRGDILDSSFAAVELKKSGLLDIATGDAWLKKVTKRGLQIADLPTKTVGRLFDLPDNVFKGWDTFNIMEKYLREWDTLPEGKRMSVPVGRGREITLVKKKPSQSGKSNAYSNGKQLTRPQLLGILARSGGEITARTFVNFKDVPIIQIAKRNTPEWDALFGSPFSGWRSVTTTVAGRQGIVGEILAGPVSRGSTNYKPLMVKRAAEAASHGALMSSVIGAEAAQLDEKDELFRTASAWSPEEAKPILMDPTGEEGVYNVWPMGNANPHEDMVDTLRMLEFGRSAVDFGLGYIDPTELSYLRPEQVKQLGSATREDLAKMSAGDRALYKAAKGLSDSTVQGTNVGWKRALDMAYVGGSAIADAYVDFAEAKGMPGSSNAAIIAFITKTAMRTFVPGYIGKGASAYYEWRIPDIKKLRDKVLADDSLSAYERDEEVARLDSEIGISRWLAGYKYRAPVETPGGGALERASTGFITVMLDHMFNMPRHELMIGDKSKTDEALKEMKKRAISAVMDRTAKRLKGYDEDIGTKKRKIGRLTAGPERSALSTEYDNLKAAKKRLKESVEKLEFYLDQEFDARRDLLKDQSRLDAILHEGTRKHTRGTEKRWEKGRLDSETRTKMGRIRSPDKWRQLR